MKSNSTNTDINLPVLAGTRKNTICPILECVIVLWTANTERYTDVVDGLNMTAEQMLTSIEKSAEEVILYHHDKNCTYILQLHRCRHRISSQWLLYWKALTILTDHHKIHLFQGL